MIIYTKKEFDVLCSGLASSDVNAFRDDLQQYWFMPYIRSGGPLNSSGFEHTFIGEIKSNAGSGFHNWVSFYFEEKNGNIQYGSYQSTYAVSRWST